MRILRKLKAVLRLPRETFVFFKDIVDRRNLIRELVRRDFTQRFAGRWLGLFWAFVEPLIMTLIFWVVFGSGLRGSGVIEGIPFIAWFLPAIVAWNYFSDVFSSGTGSIQAFSYLVKKVDFKLSILPIVKIMSALIVQSIFFVIMVIILALNGIYPDLYWFQILYYLFSASCFLLGVTWLTSSVSLFIKDVHNIVGIFLRVGFYATPIIWDIKMIPENFRIFFKLNPAYYLTNGYRNTFVYHRLFWEETNLLLYFWGLTFFFLLTGVFVYRRLRPHFADVV